MPDAPSPFLPDPPLRPDQPALVARAQAAAWNAIGAAVASGLSPAAPLHAVIEPGDSTSYRLVVCPPAVALLTGPEPTEPCEARRTDWTVALTNFGRCAEWSGEPVHYEYAVEKWGGGHLWTGVIVAAFLNEVAAWASMPDPAPASDYLDNERPSPE